MQCIFSQIYYNICVANKSHHWICNSNETLRICAYYLLLLNPSTFPRLSFPYISVTPLSSIFWISHESHSEWRTSNKLYARFRSFSSLPPRSHHCLVIGNLFIYRITQCSLCAKSTTYCLKWCIFNMVFIFFIFRRHLRFLIALIHPNRSIPTSNSI